MINNRIDLIDTKVDDIAKTASDAYDTTHGLDKDLKLVKEELESLKLNNITLTNKLDDSINRSMRGNLVFLQHPRRRR